MIGGRTGHDGEMDLHHVHRGTGRPLLLIHGLGSSWHNWKPVLGALAAEREVIAVDLPGFGETAPLEEAPTMAALADAVTAFIARHELGDVDLVGSSIGARLVLELARRCVGGTTVALDPGGFWSPGEVAAFDMSLQASLPLIRALQPVAPQLAGNSVARTLLLAQFSARPWALDRDVVLHELRTLASSPATDATLHELVHGPVQEGGPTRHRVVIGWGRQDRVTLPRQAARAQERFPDAGLVWFGRCGHFPHWDRPDATARVILTATA